MCTSDANKRRGTITSAPRTLPIGEKIGGVQIAKLKICKGEDRPVLLGLEDNIQQRLQVQN